jgi:Lipase (class 3)
MGPSVDYSAEQDDLYYPCKRGNFFPNGRPKSDAVLCAEMARLAYCKQEGSFAFDREKIADKLNRILRVVELSRAKDCTVFWQCAKTGKSKMNWRCSLFEEPIKMTLPTLPMTWTSTRRDGGGMAGRCTAVLRMHLLIYGRKERPLDQLLQPFTCRVLYTGHSLGAALATLAASLWPPQALYTIGSPRVGDSVFVGTLSQVECHRYVDCCDIVTRIPLEELGFAHCGKPYYINRHRAVVFNPNSLTIALDRFLAAREYFAKYTWMLGKVPLRELADHSPINYVWAITADERI